MITSSAHDAQTSVSTHAHIVSFVLSPVLPIPYLSPSQIQGIRDHHFSYLLALALTHTLACICCICLVVVLCLCGAPTFSLLHKLLMPRHICVSIFIFSTTLYITANRISSSVLPPAISDLSYNELKLFSSAACKGGLTRFAMDVTNTARIEQSSVSTCGNRCLAFTFDSYVHSVFLNVSCCQPPNSNLSPGSLIALAQLPTSKLCATPTQQKVPRPSLQKYPSSSRRQFIPLLRLCKTLWSKQPDRNEDPPTRTPSRLAPRLIRHLALRAGSGGSGGEVCVFGVCPSGRGVGFESEGLRVSVCLTHAWRASAWVYSSSFPRFLAAHIHTLHSLCPGVFMGGSRSRRDKSAVRSHRRTHRGVFFLTFLAKFGRFPTKSCLSERQAGAGCHADKVACFVRTHLHWRPAGMSRSRPSPERRPARDAAFWFAGLDGGRERERQKKGKKESEVSTGLRLGGQQTEWDEGKCREKLMQLLAKEIIQK